MIKAQLWGVALVASAVLAACGGSGDSAAPVAPPVVPSSITVAGTAAKGAALAGAAVSIKCAGGTGSATTAADGKYTVTITGASLPCALKAVGTDGTTFHSLLAGTASSGDFAANLSPLTEMLVAKAAGVAPSAYFSNFAAGTAPSAATVAAAIVTLKAMTAALIDLSGVNPVSDALVAASGGTAGNALDVKIDKLVAALATAQTTLAAVTTAIVDNPAAPDAIRTILAPAAQSCSWLRSGKYRMINPKETDPLWKAHVLEIDAVASTVRTWNGEVSPFVVDSNCQITLEDVDATHTVMVSSAGVLVTYSQSKTSAADRSITIGLPEQTLPVAETAGTWSIAGWNPNTGSAVAGYVGQVVEATVDSNGQVTALKGCQGLAACNTDTGPFPKFSTNGTSGAFDLIANGAPVGRAFLFKNLAGKAALVVVNNDGEWLVGTRKAVLTLPAVGDVSNFNEFSLNGNGTLSALAANTNTVTGVDTASRTVSRIRSADSRVDRIGYDKPRDGLRYRALNDCTTGIGGPASNCSENVQFPLQGMGITLSLGTSTSPSNAFFNFSVGKPN